jgi:hypothetical protein
MDDIKKQGTINERIHKRIQDIERILKAKGIYVQQDTPKVNNLKRKLSYVQSQKHIHSKKASEEVEKLKSIIDLTSERYDQEVENIRHEIETYVKRKERDILELVSKKQQSIKRYETKLEEWTNCKTVNYYECEIGRFNDAINQALGKTEVEIRLELELEDLKVKYQHGRYTAQHIQNIIDGKCKPGTYWGQYRHLYEPPENITIQVNPSPTPSIVQSIDPPSDDASSVDSNEELDLEEQVKEMREKAKRELDAERLKYQQEQEDKVRVIQEHNAAIRKRVKELRDIEDKLKEGTPEREAARKERQRAERELR